MTKTFRFMVEVEVPFPLGASEDELRDRAQDWLEQQTELPGIGITSARVMIAEEDLPEDS